MSGSRSRNKGAGYEREVVNDFRARRFDAARTAPMQAGHPDTMSDVTVAIDGGLRIECKRRKAGFSLIYSALKGNDAVAFRQDGRESLVALRLTDFIALHERLREQPPAVAAEAYAPAGLISNT